MRRNEVLGFLRQPLGDLCISRPKERLAWGIELPFDPEYVTYVWFDALTNYITAPGYGTADPRFERFWPAVHHLVGKDILTTHAVYWPTMLTRPGRAAAHDLRPRLVDRRGQKMSKSVGNVVDPGELADSYGVDALRYFLLREVPFGPDGDFSHGRFGRFNTDWPTTWATSFPRHDRQVLRREGAGRAFGGRRLGAAAAARRPTRRPRSNASRPTLR